MQQTGATDSPQRSLARRYAVVIGGVAAMLVLASGLSEMYFSYRESRAHMARLQSAQAQGAAREIEQYLSAVEAGVRDAAKLPWGQPDFDLAARRQEFQRLMVLYPAISELQWVDGQQREQLFVSRKINDRLNAGLAVEPVNAAPTASAPVAASSPADAARYGEPYFLDATEPTVRLALPDHGPDGSSTVATLNLRFLVDVMSRAALGQQGQAYVVDQANRLISHPAATHVSRRLDMSAFPAVRMMRETESAPSTASAAQDSVATGAVDAEDLDGQPVIASAARVAPTGWLVVIEQPRSQVLQPALLTLGRTIILMLLGAGAAVAAGLLFASRMAAPILRLRRAAGRIAHGELDLRVEVRTGDEIELLADDFNAMAGRLQASYAELEAKVQERTHELSVAKVGLEAQAGELARLNKSLLGNLQALHERTEEAERANAAKTRFLAAASHDLRQPMHTIGLLTGVLRERLPDAHLAQLADKVLASVAVMENLFGSLLDISKLDAGAVRPHRDSFRVQVLLDRLRESFEPQAAERRLQLRVRACRGVVRSDITILERIFGNLISNALSYTREGGVLVGCRQRGDHLAIQILDTGIGIAPQYLDHIFEEFYRIDETQTGRGEGLGLGLSIVKRSAEMLGHRLVVSSIPTRGSRFELQVPLVPRYADALETMPHAAVSSGGLTGNFVLILDDNAENRDALRLLCEQWNAQVLCAASTSEALTQLSTHLRSPDLIITDYKLSHDLDGIDAIEQVRGFAEEPVPAILLTADADHAWAHRFATLGDAVVLIKPAGASRLYAAAMEVMQRSPA